MPGINKVEGYEQLLAAAIAGLIRTNASNSSSADVAVPFPL